MSDPQAMTLSASARTPSADEVERLAQLPTLPLNHQPNGDRTLVLPDAFSAIRCDGHTYAMQLRLIEQGTARGGVLVGIEPHFGSADPATPSAWLKHYPLPMQWQLKAVAIGPINADDVPDIGLILDNGQQLVIAGETVEDVILHRLLELERVNAELKTRIEAYRERQRPIVEQTKVIDPEPEAFTLQLRLAEYFTDLYYAMQSALAQHPSREQRTQYLEMLHTRSGVFLQTLTAMLESYHFHFLLYYCHKFFELNQRRLDRYWKGEGFNLSPNDRAFLIPHARNVDLLRPFGGALLELVTTRMAPQQRYPQLLGPPHAEQVFALFRVFFRIQEGLREAGTLSEILHNVIHGISYEPLPTGRLLPF